MSALTKQENDFYTIANSNDTLSANERLLYQMQRAL
jgi:hypothetical protein